MKPPLEARIQSFEMAYRMQTDASDAFDITREPKHILDLYGPGTQARQILIARRLLERGVRFVQVWTGAGQPWDSHDDIEKNHGRLARDSDQAIAALLIDLKQRGMLDDTLVIWGGEFGRTPTVELPTPGSNAGHNNGRDHNNHGFTMWLAGGGVKAATFTAPPTISASPPPTTPSMSTISTPPSWRCSGSITPSSPTATPAGISG